MALKDDWLTGDVYTADDQNDVADEVNGKVPSSRTVSAGTGLSGGGDLSTNRTLAADFGSGAGKVCEGNDSRLSDTRTPTDNSVTSAKIVNGAITNDDINASAGIVATKLATAVQTSLGKADSAVQDVSGKADKSTTISAGTGLTGGGDLSANRTLTVAYGSTSSTACVGNDSRLSDARTPSDNSVTSAKIVDGAIVNADINASAAIVATKLASGVQTSLGKADTATQPADLSSAIAAAQTVDINAQTGTTYTLVVGDASKAVECSNASAITLTVPPNASVAFAVGTVIEVLQVGAGQVTLAPGSGVTLNAANGLKTSKQWSAVTLRKRATNDWLVAGDAAS